jgi:hypothetical protein
MSNPTSQSFLNRASKDKFILVLNLPDVLKQQANTDPTISIDPLQISVFGTIVPTITVPAVEARYGGQTLNFSSHSRPTYPPLNVSFVVDNKYSNYYLLWKWLALLNDPKQSIYNGTEPDKATFNNLLRSGINTEYQTDLSILALDEYNKTTIEFQYSNAFITSLGGINYSYRDGEILESTVEFQFNQINIIKTVT